MNEHTQLYIDWVNQQITGSSDQMVINLLQDLTDGVTLVRLVERITHTMCKNLEVQPKTKEERIKNILDLD